MIVLTMITENYLRGFFHFYHSFRLNNKHKIICYLLNFPDDKKKAMREEFSDVDFEEHIERFTAPSEKWHPSGVLRVTHLKGYLMHILSRRFRYADKLVWIDASKLVMGSIEFMDTLLNEYEWVGTRRETTKETKMYFAGFFGFRRGDELERYSKRCMENRMQWFTDQIAFTKLGGKFKDLPYNEYVSGQDDLYNPNKLIVRNLGKGSTDKFSTSEEYFVKILSEKIPHYKEKYAHFLNRFPKKIMAFNHVPEKEWCFMSGIKNVSKAIDIEVIEKPKDAEYLKGINPDLVWSRGGIFLMRDLFRVRPDLRSKTVSTMTWGDAQLGDRIEKVLSDVEGSKAIIAQNMDAKVRMDYHLKKKGWDIPVFLIPNGVDLEHFTPKDKPKEFIVGFAGRRANGKESYLKGWHLFSMAMDILGLPFKVASNMDGERYSYEQMPDFYNSVSCLVLPSSSEGHSNVVNEAMACGLPVIMTPVGWHSEVCIDKKHLLFCARNVYDIMRKVSYLKENPKEAKLLGQNARAFCEEHLSLGKTNDIFKELFYEKV